MTTVRASGSRDRSPARFRARFMVRVVAAVLVRPALWLTAVRQLGRLAPRGWWRRPPFLPLPDPDYLKFRLETQYGAATPANPADIVVYLEWCRGSGR